MEVQEVNADSFSSHVAVSLKKYLHPGHFTVANAVLIACVAVETYAHERGNLSGIEKRKWAQLLVPQVIDACIHNHYIDADAGENLKVQLNAVAGMLAHFIDAYVFIANQPAMLQIAEEVKTCCAGLCKRK